MKKVKSAYNFVPVSERVYFPKWAKDISMDIPFRDGLSGKIELTMTSQTPVFVCDGHKEGEKKEVFSNYQGLYFIPGTSIKGMVRNLLGVMSFGKMKTDPRARYAQREWGNDKLYPLKSKQQSKEGGFNCGWLKPKYEQIDGGVITYEIIDCGKPYRISHKEIDTILENKKLSHFFSENSSINLNKPIDGLDPKTAYFKYKHIIQDRDLLVGYSFQRLSAENYKVKIDDDGNGDILGTIVLTGQPDKWTFPRSKKNSGKFYEFVFRNYDTNSVRHVLNEKEFENFSFIYEKSDDWTLAKERLKKEGIPVFFRLDENKKIKDFGLAYLYKLPYEHTPQECLGADHRKTVESPDLKECIFGYSENIEGDSGNTKNESLRGRVQFTHAFAVGSPQVDERKTLILASPKASYYHFYINQKNKKLGVINGSYSTYNESNSRLSGWKRYPMRESESKPLEKMDSEKLETNIVPLKTGSTFKCYINFHNLTFIELGAMLSALTFHNTPNCYHQLGQAKPYGFGRMKFEAKLMGYLSGKEEELMAYFELEMDKFLESSWAQNSSIKELFTLASVLVEVNDERFEYPILDIKGDNDFVEYKGGVTGKGPKSYLERFSVIMGKTVTPISLSSRYKDRLILFLDEKNREILDKENQRLAYLQRLKEEEERVNQEKEKAKLAEKIEAGIKFEITKKDNNGKYRIQSFKNLKDRCESFLKTQRRETGQTLFNKKDIEAVYETLQRINQKRDKKETKQWINFEDKFIWGSIRSWVGDEVAKQWFDVFNK